MASYKTDLPVVKDLDYSGDSVRLIQAILYALAKKKGSSNTLLFDAKYGNQTKEAVKQFQKEKKLKNDKDGQVGQETWIALMDALKSLA